MRLPSALQNAPITREHASRSHLSVTVTNPENHKTSHGSRGILGQAEMDRNDSHKNNSRFTFVALSLHPTLDMG